MTEQWKEVKGFPFYEISNKGNIKRLRRINRRGQQLTEILLSPCVNNVGYYAVDIMTANYKRRTMKIHQLMAITFLNHKTNGYKKVVDHIDENKLNNNLNNLQVLTHKENINKSFAIKSW